MSSEAECGLRLYLPHSKTAESGRSRLFRHCQKVDCDRVDFGLAGMSAKRDDKQLVAQAQEGDRDAYSKLVERYQPRAFGIAYGVLKSRDDAEDVVQESFVKAFLSLPDFRGQASFYTWLYRIVFNMAVDLKRRTARRGGAPIEYDESYMNSSSTDTSTFMGKVEGPHAALIRKEQARRIRLAMQGLSDEHRTVVELREYDGLSYDEISDIVGISRGTVMSRLHYARKKLQSALADVMPAQQSQNSDLHSDGAGAELGPDPDPDGEQNLNDTDLHDGELKRGEL